MRTTPFNIIGNRKWWYIISVLLILPGIISLFVWGLNVGIDFKGGSLLQVKYEQGRPEIEEIRSALSTTDIPGIQVQTGGENDLLVKFPNTDNRDGRNDANTILATLKKDNSGVGEQSFENIGGSVASDTTKSAYIAVVIAALAIMTFIAWAFSSVPKPASSWRFGMTAVLSLLHDLIFVIGTFSIIGHFFISIEIDALFITAMLTIMGYSINDTIVVFDRIRENLRRSPGKSFEQVANESLNQTIARSINSSLTVLFVLCALLLLGGESIRNFVLALTLGVAVGTYSSIFNASPLLVTWQSWSSKRVDKK